MKLSSLSLKPVEKNQSFFQEIKKNIDILTEKIKKIAIRIFETLKKVITFPSRYLGAKTFSLPGLLLRLPVVGIKHLLGRNDPNLSFKEELLCEKGYHQFEYENLSGGQAKDYLIHAAAAAAVQKNKPKWLEPFGYQSFEVKKLKNRLIERFGFEDKGDHLYDEKTGLKIAIFVKNDEVLVTFGALGSHATEYCPEMKQLSENMNSQLLGTAISSVLGARPKLFSKAEKFLACLREDENFKGKNITLTGQCLGGAIASYVSLKQQLKAVVLNGFLLGPGLQKKIGEKNLRSGDKYLTQIIAEGDLFADVHPVLKGIDWVVNFLGLRTVGNFGKKYKLPTIYKGKGIIKDTMNTHQLIIGSLFAHLMPEHKELCQNIQKGGDDMKKFAELFAQSVSTMMSASSMGKRVHHG